MQHPYHHTLPLPAPFFTSFPDGGRQVLPGKPNGQHLQHIIHSVGRYTTQCVPAIRRGGGFRLRVRTCMRSGALTGRPYTAHHQPHHTRRTTNHTIHGAPLIELYYNVTWRSVYNGCNPQPDYSVQCHAYEKGDGVCWYNTTCGHHDPKTGNFSGAIGPFCLEPASAAAAAEKKFVKDFEGVCDRRKCTCEDELTNAVGNWPCVFCRAGRNTLP